MAWPEVTVRFLLLTTDKSVAGQHADSMLRNSEASPTWMGYKVYDGTSYQNRIQFYSILVYSIVFWIWLNLFTCVHIYIHICTCVYIYNILNIYIHVHMQYTTCWGWIEMHSEHLWIDVYIYIYICIYWHIYIYIYYITEQNK